MFRLKNLFCVAEGEKVTEKCFRRVLLSSICGILLCMTGLVSTTWALFSATVESQNNVIQVGAFDPVITVMKVDAVEHTVTDVLPEGNTYKLQAGSYAITIASSKNSSASGYCEVDLDGKTYQTVRIYPQGTENEISVLTYQVEVSVNTIKNSEMAALEGNTDAGEASGVTTEPPAVVMTITPKWGAPTLSDALLNNDGAPIKIELVQYVAETVDEELEEEESEEQAEEQPGEEPGEQPGDEPGEQPGDEPGEQPGDEPGEQPGEEPGEQPGDEPGEQPGEEPGEQPGDEPGEEPGEQPGDEPGEEPGEQPGDEPGEEPGEQPGDEPGEETGEQPGDEPGDEPGEEPGEQPGEQPAE